METDKNKINSEDWNKIKAILDELDIKFDLIYHEEVFTVEAMMVHLEKISGQVCKNLFVKDKKKKRLWLIVAKHDRQVNLNIIAKKLNVSGGFRFANEEILFEKLGVRQGCVTPLAVLNDKQCDVTVILDSILISNSEENIYCHPMVNSASVGIKSSKFLQFLRHVKHDPIIVDFSD